MPAASLNFKNETDVLLGLIGAEGGLAILGGVVAVDELAAFMGAWQFVDMPYRIWEYVSDIQFKSDELADGARLHLLERGRVFGHGGDLEIRRDADIVRWHFTGLQSQPLPAGYEALDFWSPRGGEGKNDSPRALRAVESSVLLWGEHRGDGRWFESRVGAADLRYPDEARSARLCLNYTAFLLDGQEAFVWWKELAAHA